MEGKSILTSKTFWMNVMGLAAIVVQSLTGEAVLDESAQTGILAVLNIIMRFFTKRPIG